MATKIMEQFINIFYTLIPVLVVLAWIAIAALIIWAIVKFVKKQQTTQK